MNASLLNGKQVAEKLEAVLANNIRDRMAQGELAPGLAVICVGEDKASQIYVKNKRKACERVGMLSLAYDLPANTSEYDLLHLIQKLNQANHVHGILVQLPLPPHINPTQIIEAILPEKDVDGFHPYNLGKLAQGSPLLRPCTPYGIIQLLDHYKLPIESQHAVMVGASNLVGRPMALEFLLRKATVTVCHSKTKDLEEHVRHADLLVIATGVPNVVNPRWLSQHQVVIDVGMHRNSLGVIHGDLDFQAAQKKVAWITPVPKGVGPMTIYTLLKNTLHAATAYR
ncbi:MAG: bifunctional methylenetetrahydrofolate dehydrogenase/methenyltetrahydrofolate cyclohydrolase FolD [Legionellaceae bacterium]